LNKFKAHFIRTKFQVHMIIDAHAYARAGLLGNPSDGYFGKTISIIVRNFGARVQLYETPELHIESQIQDTNVYRNISHLIESVSLVGYYGGSRLIKAAIKKFYEYCTGNKIKIDNKNFTIRYHSSIPRQVGLAGSSAIITATLRALMQFYHVKIPLDMLPNITLLTETEELGITAGLQDRVIQAYEGCVYMDFDKAIMETRQCGKYEKLDPSLLPRLFIAYKIELGKISGKVHSDLRTRWENGDPLVVNTLNEIAGLAETGRKAILDRDVQKLHELMNRNFDLRASIMNISPANRAMVDAARSCGASSHFTGSGGSIIGIYYSNEMLTQLIMEMKKLKARIIKPYIV
jgi:glucuronokinase